MNDLPGGKRDNAVTGQRLQPGSGGFVCAVPGIEARGQGEQLRGCFTDALCTGLGQEEAADEDIGAEVGGDIENTAVGTAADEYALSCFFDEQVLRMPPPAVG